MAHLQVIKGGEVMGMGLADYIWLDDHGQLNFKKMSVLIGKNEKGEPVPLAERQTTQHFLDCTNNNCPSMDGWGECSCEPKHTTRILVPCFYLPDPTRPQPSYIVLCEVRDNEDFCIETNNRAKLRKALKARGPQSNLIWFGYEQDYAMQEANSAIEDDGFEARAFNAAERHIGACFDAGLFMHSAWDSPGAEMWDFKIGYRGFPQDLDPDPPNPLVVSDHLVIARYLMEKIGGGKGLAPKWDNLCAYVSTPAMRDPGDPLGETEALVEKLADVGETRIVPHPSRKNTVRCIEVDPDEACDPYNLALDVLNVVWPLAEIIEE